MKGFFDMFFYNSILMSVITLICLISFKYLKKRYLAKWMYSISVFIAALWVLPFRPTIELPTIISKVPQTAPVLLPSMLKEMAKPSVLPDLVIHADKSLSLGAILFVLWLFGIGVVTTYYFIRHKRFTKYVKRWSSSITDSNILQLFDSVKKELGIEKQVGLKKCKGITTPMLMGLWNPTVLLPNSMLTEVELYYILKHECIHYKQKHLESKLLVLIATVLHFFNPVVWVMAKSIEIQCELACDEQVVKGLDVIKRKDYGKTIIKTVTRQKNYNPILSTNFYGGKSDMKTRIVSITDNNKKKSGLMILSFLMLALIFTACSSKSESKTVVGYMVFEENTLILDEVEVIMNEGEDEDRIEELGLTELDMPNGYYFHNPSKEQSKFELTDETIYTFTDVGLLFVEDPDGNRIYTTTKKEEFLQHLNTTYGDVPPAQKVPYYIEVKDGKVINITEKFLFTM